MSDQNDQEAQALAQPERLPTAGKRSSVTIFVGGMSCANCVATVERSLRRLKGVLNVHVDLAAGTAEVEMTPGEVAYSDLRRAVEKAGYRVENLSGM